MWIVILLCSFIMTVFLLSLFRRYAIEKNLLDHPNHRSSHTIPTPRGGGLIFVGVWLFVAVLLVITHDLPAYVLSIFLFPAFLVAMIGYWDDVRGLSPKGRLAVQLSAAMIMLYALHLYFPVIHAYFLEMLITIFLLLSTVWSTNLFNFMDGTDGYATLEAIMLFVTGGFFFWVSGGQAIAQLAWLLSAVLLGFLVWNRPKAKIFMGDVASGFLGFLILPFAILGQLQYHISLLLWFMLYLTFSLDATLTLARRFLRGERWYEAHKSHAYQRLHQSGFSHGQVLLASMVLNTILLGLALIGFYIKNALPFCVLAAIMIAFAAYYAVEKKHPMVKDDTLRKAGSHESYS